MRGKCGRCGKLLPYSAMWTVTEKHIAGSAGQAYMLCKDCMEIVDAAIRMAVDVAKGNRCGEEDDALRDYRASQIAAEAERRLGETCSIEWRGESYDTDAGREYDGAYFCTKCMADLPQPLQECWDDYQTLKAYYGNVKPWNEKPFLRCPNCGRKVMDA